MAFSESRRKSKLEGAYTNVSMCYCSWGVEITIYAHINDTKGKEFNFESCALKRNQKYGKIPQA